MTPRKRYVGRLYLGHGKYRWLGRFDTRKARDMAVANARVDHQRKRLGDQLTCDEWADRFLVRYERTRKRSSFDTARASLRRFRRDFGYRHLADVTRLEALDWAERQPASAVPVVVQLFNAAVDAELLERNPFRGLGHKGRGRADEKPPTPAELDRLLNGCAALGWYAPQMRALLVFAAYTGLRPGELYALEWDDIDFDRKRIRVERGVYRGHVQSPKSNKARTVALTPPARDVLLRHPRDGSLVFRSKRGNRLSQATLSGYWGQVKARSGLSHDFYLATKHFCVHYMHATLKLEPRVIAEQMGWTLAGVVKLLAVYGHGDVGALEEVDRAFARNVVQIQDATKTLGVADDAS